MPRLFNMYAQPTPPSEVVNRLKQVDDRLDLRYVAYPHQDGPNANVTEYWAVIQRWRQDDKRRQMIQLGQMSEEDDYDIMAKLPVDCSVDDAYNYFLRGVRGKLDSHKDARYVIDRIHKYNDSVKQEALKETTELAEELIDANKNTLFREQKGEIPRVFQSGGKKKSE